MAQFKPTGLQILLPQQLDQLFQHCQPLVAQIASMLY